MASNSNLLTLSVLCTFLFLQCQSDEKDITGRWEYSSANENGRLMISKTGDQYHINLYTFDLGEVEMKDVKLTDSVITGHFKKWNRDVTFTGLYQKDSLNGNFESKRGFESFNAYRFVDQYVPIDRSEINYLISDSDINAYEKDIDHAGMIRAFSRDYLVRGERVYNNNCINCHGLPDMEGSIPLSLKFWSEPFKAGNDPYSMYVTITKGIGSMPPQVTLTPQEKYDVIAYIREAFIRRQNEDEYYTFGEKYLSNIPKGSERGPSIKPYHPWKDMDYGNFFINTYELVDSATGPERFHSPGPTPYPDEDYSKNNFAYKGIAVRLDEGDGGVAKGNAFMIFDHDLMRVAGGWTGDGFIDWKAILLNDEHETYPRTVGKLHFETPVGPGWANPANGSFEDPRFTARDGRQFGPLPRSWADYQGLYYYEGKAIISYKVGSANALETFGVVKEKEETIFTRTINISGGAGKLQMRVAPIGSKVILSGDGELKEVGGFTLLDLSKTKGGRAQLFIANNEVDEAILEEVSLASEPEDLSNYTKGGKAQYPEIVKSVIIEGIQKGAFTIDELTPPYENPWECRMKLSGIDFMSDANIAIVCATDGDVWKITGLTDGSTDLKWQRIGSGLFQPLGVKVLNDEIFVTCRDQIVRLQDLNGDGETDFYESFNHDHQVSDHFHEFTMGLQADDEGNLYYAKSGRHAREALIPRHGTLIKVSNDGKRSEIVATGFRAANGVCINPDGSFIVTDQQGYWNPMNRINWVEVEGKPKFYGNMWGYNPPKDSSRTGMEQPMVWVDMDFDRSPSELLWVDSKKWGPLDGKLLSFSYGYGKIQLVLQEEVQGMRQGGVIDLPGIKFLTGVMRGRFNPQDQHLYACGMSAWGTSQLMRGGGLYRIRYTGDVLDVPVELNVAENGVALSFAQELDQSSAMDPENFRIEMWDLKRSKAYGSDRYNRRDLEIADVTLSGDNKSVLLICPDIGPVDVMTITYSMKDREGNQLEGTVQNTIHKLEKSML
ncbi:DUF6797 domain-containing protein [Portibacter marinus]|uniref:DUF6797 domain-containing protein n=1 Tax=Portibacter marinus TaxID=2898660 RepID=UPI001F39A600|nr:DUF6797 domain-containing protein [Portibacter marinus]